MKSLIERLKWRLKIGWSYHHTESRYCSFSDLFINDKTGEHRWEHDDE